MATSQLQVEKKLASEQSIKERLEAVRAKAAQSMSLAQEAGAAVATAAAKGNQSLTVGSEAIAELTGVINDLDPSTDLAKQLRGIKREARDSNTTGAIAVANVGVVAAQAGKSAVEGLEALADLDRVIASFPPAAHHPVVAFSVAAIAARDATVEATVEVNAGAAAEPQPEKATAKVGV